MATILPTVDVLQAQHTRLAAQVTRLSALEDMLDRGEGFDELDQLTQSIHDDLDSHFPAYERLMTGLFEDDSESNVELKAQHQAVVLECRTLLQMIQDIREDMMVDREQFMTLLRGVIQQLQAHLDLEGRLLRPRLGKG